jgi:hypothetical protein
MLTQTKRKKRKRSVAETFEKRDKIITSNET